MTSSDETTVNHNSPFEHNYPEAPQVTFAVVGVFLEDLRRRIRPRPERAVHGTAVWGVFGEAEVSNLHGG